MIMIHWMDGSNKTLCTLNSRHQPAGYYRGEMPLSFPPTQVALKSVDSDSRE